MFIFMPSLAMGVGYPQLTFLSFFEKAWKVWGLEDPYLVISQLDSEGNHQKLRNMSHSRKKDLGEKTRGL